MAACWSHLVLIAIAAIIGISLSASIEKQNNFDTYAPQKDSYLPPKDMLFAMDPIDQCLFACTTCFKEVSFTMLRPTCCSQFPWQPKAIIFLLTEVISYGVYIKKKLCDYIILHQKLLVVVTIHTSVCSLHAFLKIFRKEHS